MSRRRTLSATAALAAAVMSLAAPLGSAAAATPLAQSAVSMSGVLSKGSLWSLRFPDGSERGFQAMMVLPGVASGTPAQGAADLTRPWAVLDEAVYSDPANGNGDLGPRCSSFSNPQTSTYGSGDPLTAWNGMSFDTTCDDGSGYAFYRVTWSQRPDFGLVTNPLVMAWVNDELATWSASGVQGSVVLWPTAEEITTMTVCGWKPDASVQAGHFDCYGSDTFGGEVIPAVSLMLMQDVPASNGS